MSENQGDQTQATDEAGSEQAQERTFTQADIDSDGGGDGAVDLLADGLVVITPAGRQQQGGSGRGDQGQMAWRSIEVHGLPFVGGGRFHGACKVEWAFRPC